MNILDQIFDVLSLQKKALHVDEIAILLAEQFPNQRLDLNELPSKISSALSADIKKKGAASLFTKPKNKAGRPRKGMYRVKRKRLIEPKASPSPSVSTQYTGKAGESAVIGELLFYGYNASAMAVDDGIDVVANKDNNYFHIQVKTANQGRDDAFTFTITKKIFLSKHSSQTFYVLVMRLVAAQRHYNDYVILPSSEIKKQIQQGIIKDSERYSLRVKRDENGRYLLNKTYDITSSINQFDHIV